jgi:polar amino acid transport system substrate-binding protein
MLDPRGEREEVMEKDEGKPDLPERRRFFGASVAAVAAGAGVAAIAGAARPASAQDKPQSKLYEVLDRGHLIVGTGSTNPPWHFEDDSGKLVGMDIDMAKLMAKGLFEDAEKVEFVREAPDARIPNLVTNKVDVVFQFMSVTAGRAAQVEFTVPYYREGGGLLMAKGGRFKSFDEMLAAGGDVTVSILQNVYAEDLVHSQLPQAKVLQLDTPANSVQAVQSKKADAVLLDSSTVKWLIAQHGDLYIDSGREWGGDQYSAAVKPGDHIWLKYLDTAISSGLGGNDFEYYQASYKKWFGTELRRPPLGYPVLFKTPA